MSEEASVIERAFQLASECANLEDVKRKLKREGYFNVDAHFSGGSLKADLKKLLRPPS
jgi:hypothetical protein